MASKDASIVVAIFDGEGIAHDAADKLKDWDKASDSIALGAMSILALEDGKVVTKKAGKRETGKGAKWGAIAGLVAGVLSGGLTLLGGLAIGAIGGGLIGALKKSGAPISDEYVAQLNKAVESGKSALVVMCDEGEVADTEAELKAMGGDTRSFIVPAEVMAAVEEAPEVKQAAQDAVDSTGNALNEVADQAGDAADKAGAAISDAADATASAVSDAADAASDAVS